MEEEYEVDYVSWQHEDELPDDLPAGYYDLMYPLSQVKGNVGCRVFPYILRENKKVYLMD
jgi:hypothetical protein